MQLNRPLSFVCAVSDVKRGTVSYSTATSAKILLHSIVRRVIKCPSSRRDSPPPQDLYMSPAGGSEPRTGLFMSICAQLLYVYFV